MPGSAFLSAPTVRIDLADFPADGLTDGELKLKVIPGTVFRSKLTFEENPPKELTVTSYFVDPPGATISEDGETDTSNCDILVIVRVADAVFDRVPLVPLTSIVYVSVRVDELEATVSTE